MSIESDNKLYQAVREETIDEIRKVINNSYHLSQDFYNELSPTYPFRMIRGYNKDLVITALRHFCNSLDNQLILIKLKAMQKGDKGE